MGRVNGIGGRPVTEIPVVKRNVTGGYRTGVDKQTDHVEASTVCAEAGRW